MHTSVTGVCFATKATFQIYSCLKYITLIQSTSSLKDVIHSGFHVMRAGAYNGPTLQL